MLQKIADKIKQLEIEHDETVFIELYSDFSGTFNRFEGMCGEDTILFEFNNLDELEEYLNE